jgi:hypothetical protein
VLLQWSSSATLSPSASRVAKAKTAHYFSPSSPLFKRTSTDLTCEAGPAHQQVQALCVFDASLAAIAKAPHDGPFALPHFGHVYGHHSSFTFS